MSLVHIILTHWQKKQQQQQRSATQLKKHDKQPFNYLSIIPKESVSLKPFNVHMASLSKGFHVFLFLLDSHHIHLKYIL